MYNNSSQAESFDDNHLFSLPMQNLSNNASSSNFNEALQYPYAVNNTLLNNQQINRQPLNLNSFPLSNSNTSNIQIPNIYMLNSLAGNSRENLRGFSNDNSPNSQTLRGFYSSNNSPLNAQSPIIDVVSTGTNSPVDVRNSPENYSMQNINLNRENQNSNNYGQENKFMQLSNSQNNSLQNIATSIRDDDGLFRLVNHLLFLDDDGLFRLVNQQYTNEQTNYLGNILPGSHSHIPNQSAASIAASSASSENKNQLPTDFPLEIKYKTYPKELYKKQKRLKGNSEQRIENGSIEFYLIFPDKLTFDYVSKIQVDVKRTNEHSGTHKYVGPVTLEPRFESAGSKEYLVKVDLDSVYKKDDKKVYELQKTLTKELNLFHLIVTVTLRDGRCCVKNTEGILLIGKKNGGGVTTGVKRTASVLRKDSLSSNDSPVLSPKRSPSSGYVTPTSPTYDEELLRVQNIVANHIKAKSAEILDVLYAKKQVSPNGDIAYHFEVKDHYTTYYEGQVIGFLSESGDDTPKIVELTSDNAKNVLLKGVVTRSQYFEARKPKDASVRTETVCMMGIVPVLVHGSVKANDALYASSSLPGFAVSERHLSFYEKQDAALIGYAFQSLKMADEDETGMVQAGISVLNSASQVLLNRRLRQLNISWTNKLHMLRKSNKNLRRCICWSSIFTAVLLSLAAIFLWQALAPGTAYRYFRCRQGSIKGRTAHYMYPTRYGFDYISVNGIEFKFDDLMDKTDEHYREFPEEGARYFLNVDRCAYGGTRRTADVNEGLHRVGGPELFAVNKDCTFAYQYFEVISNWTVIKNVSFNLKNLHCVP